MGTKNPIKVSLIAPCGMNCGICMAYLRVKNHCPGCLNESKTKSASCLNCTIKNCPELDGKGRKYCFSCTKFPCARLKHLDKRYQTKYGMSMLENQAVIKQSGIRAFVRQEKKRWTCPVCGGIINVHRWVCSECGRERKKSLESGIWRLE